MRHSSRGIALVAALRAAEGGAGDTGFVAACISPGGISTPCFLCLLCPHQTSVWRPCGEPVLLEDSSRQNPTGRLPPGLR